jgi:malonate-semialdehyde dehydrogenase (acetylating)/methylmalonate-semialdehyde dehydrogenase
MKKLFELFDQAKFPTGVINLVNGGKETAEAILNHSGIKAISFVGSTSVAKHVYALATANGKRAQCQGGAKNPIIILPDADIETASKIIADSAFGCAGQRCLAASLAVTVGDSKQDFTEAIVSQASSRVVGYGLDDGVQMGPVITQASKNRIESLILSGLNENSDLLVDGRNAKINNYESGSFVKPTIIQNLKLDGTIIHTEIFGPVLGMVHLDTVDDAIDFVNSGRYGNMACLFTNSGAAARKFRYEAQVGNIGINLGAATPRLIPIFPT